ncbi:MAG: glycosyltransferase family 2 protein [Patescibacteria group bacterium]
MKNKISVIIPTFNNADFIGECIDSVLNQSLPPKEIIIVDDGSTDQTRKIVSEFSKKYPIIKYIYQNNKGLSASRNTGIKKATGEYIAFLDSDDLWLGKKLEKQFAIFNKQNNKQLGLVYCDYEDIDQNGKKLINYPSFKTIKTLKGRIHSELASGNKISASGSGVLIRRECFDQVGLFDENLVAAEDWEMWLRISQKYLVDLVKEPLVLIRRHNNNMSSDKKRIIFGITGLAKKYQSLLDNNSFLKYYLNIVAQQLIIEFPNFKILNLVKKELGPNLTKKLTTKYYLLFFYLIYNLIAINYRKLTK